MARKPKTDGFNDARDAPEAPAMTKKTKSKASPRICPVVDSGSVNDFGAHVAKSTVSAVVVGNTAFGAMA